MKKHIPKDVILQTCIDKQQELIANFEDRVAEMKADTMGQTDSASQTEDRTAGKIELLITIEKELAFATMEMGILKAIHANFKNTKQGWRARSPWPPPRPAPGRGSRRRPGSPPARRCVQ